MCGRIMAQYEVQLVNESMHEFFVMFAGPKESKPVLTGQPLMPMVAPFEGGVWKVHVELPEQYPYKSPSIGFMSRIFHPNIDEMYCINGDTLMVARSGSVCLDVINQAWSPMFDLINVFEVFLPQLLRYPNPSDPLNGEAAALIIRDPRAYEGKVKDYVRRFASGDSHDAGAKNDAESEVSSMAYSSDDEADQMEL